jgi:CheY-like chemotaxis protein
MRILYVEDNQTNLMLVERLARIGSHEVISHSDGEAALANFETDKPDLVLMDVQLGGVLNGLDVVKTLRERGHKLPIIALTAYAMVGDRERCLAAGCDAYLPKPLPVEELVDLFQRFDPKNTTPASVQDTSEQMEERKPFETTVSESVSQPNQAVTPVVETHAPVKTEAPAPTTETSVASQPPQTTPPVPDANVTIKIEAPTTQTETNSKTS